MGMMFDPGTTIPEGPYAAGGPQSEAEAEARKSVLELWEGIFHSYADDLEKARLKVQAGEFDQVKDSRQLARDLRAAAHLVLEERNKLDKLRKEIAGDVGGGALDLAAARDEIGRRLACLRRAGGG
ncbi:permease [uncultured Paracoccus sp.]|uniref:permease n=1 Tax=uncultured Paracoccus sp. TaxID=189685 RepID=UPI002604CA03|nr:permease [uncultured Paracoccus sp.]